nr:hypothetical protein GCM10020093_012860 [Planobispora longispora]
MIGETPYAEGVGDLARRTLEAARLYPGDLAVLDKVAGKGKPVITVYVTGRPLWVNKELNRSDAFVVAWLPGTEGGGVADLLVRGKHREGYTGKLPYSWPKTACQAPLNAGDEGYDPLFPLGYGLRHGQTGSVGTLDETAPTTCGTPGGGGEATEDLELFNRVDVAPYRSYIGSAENWGGTEIGPDGTAAHAEISVVQSDVNVQQDGLKATWTGTGPAQIYSQNPAGGTDLRGYLNADAALVFDTIVHQPRRRGPSSAPTASTPASPRSWRPRCSRGCPWGRRRPSRSRSPASRRGSRHGERQHAVPGLHRRGLLRVVRQHALGPEGGRRPRRQEVLRADLTAVAATVPT